MHITSKVITNLTLPYLSNQSVSGAQVTHATLPRKPNRILWAKTRSSVPGISRYISTLPREPLAQVIAAQPDKVEPYN